MSKGSSQSPAAGDSSPLPHPWRMTVFMLAAAALTSAACAYGHWFVADMAQLLALCGVLLFVLSGVVTWRKGDRRGLTAIALPGLLWIVPLVVYYQFWSREHDAFHEMVSAIRSIQGNAPGCPDIEQHPTIAPFVQRMRGLVFERQRAVWRFYSSRHNEVYDCVERRVTFY